MRDGTRETYHQRILRVLVHIQEHLDDALSLEALAAVAWFSPYHFHRIFRGMVGESVKEHIRRLRLERAAHRLRSTDQPVTRIAFDAGYEAHETFTRAFRSMFGTPPSKYRTRPIEPASGSAPSDVHYSAEGKVREFQAVGGGASAPPVRVERFRPIRVAFMRHVGPYDQVGPTWDRFMGWAGARGMLAASPTVLSLVHDDPDVTPPERIRYDACISVPDDFEGEADVGVQSIAGGNYAVATHRGAHGRVNETYLGVFGSWLPRSGWEPRPAPAFEVYRNSPRDIAPEELLTDIHIPLETSRPPGRSEPSKNRETDHGEDG